MYELNGNENAEKWRKVLAFFMWWLMGFFRVSLHSSFHLKCKIIDKKNSEFRETIGTILRIWIILQKKKKQSQQLGRILFYSNFSICRSKTISVKFPDTFISTWAIEKLFSKTVFLIQYFNSCTFNYFRPYFRSEFLIGLLNWSNFL